MRIHTNVLTLADVTAAAQKAGVGLEVFHVYKSRSRKYSIEIQLSGSGLSGGAYGNLDYKTAVWDEWGIFLAALFAVDADMHTGRNGYHSASHFHWSTGNWYTGLTRPFIHLRHKWNPLPHADAKENYADGYVENVCDCGATRRHLNRGVEWETFRAEVLAP